MMLLSFLSDIILFILLLLLVLYEAYFKTCQCIKFMEKNKTATQLITQGRLVCLGVLASIHRTRTIQFRDLTCSRYSSVITVSSECFFNCANSS